MLADPEKSPAQRLWQNHRREILGAGGVILLFVFSVYLIWSPDAGEPANASLNKSPGSSSIVYAGAAGPVNSAAVPPESAASNPQEAGAGWPFNQSPHYPAALSIAGMDEDELRVEAIDALMETWVGTNARQAAEWAGSLPSGTFRDDALSSLMVHWASKDAAAAGAWMIRTGVDDAEATSVLASSWGTQDPGAAAGWAASVGNLESRRLATSSVAAAWAATAPQAAAAYADSLPPNDRAAAITSVLGVWATAEPAAAGAWLANLPFASEEDRALATAALITPWTAQSPAAASKYINTIPEGPAREAAASQFAVTAAPYAPAEALMWGMNIADPDQRNQVVADACESWLVKSPETFRSGIEEAIKMMEDPAMRRGVYEMLYEQDPAFHDSLLSMADAPSAPPPAPAPEPPPTPTPSATPELEVNDFPLIPPMPPDLPDP